MKRHWQLVFTAASMLAAGCYAGDTEFPSSDENLGSSRQKEVLSDCAPFTDTDIGTIKFDQELLINDLAVVNDSVNNNCRTSWGKSGCDPNTSGNKWHFWYLMQQMAGTNNVTKFVLRWLESIESWPNQVNGQMLDPRPGIRTQIINLWMTATNTANGNNNCVINQSINTSANLNCQLRPELSPFRLLAIVNRMDLRLPDGGSGYGGGLSGEGRMVFGAFHQTTKAAIQATVIFEYTLPTQDPFFFDPSLWTTLDWANNWHSLGAFTTFDVNYNNQLQIITEKFVKAGSNPFFGFNLGSAISQVRFNERVFDENAVEPLPPQVDERQWSLREFKLDCFPGEACDGNALFLVPVPVAQAPGNQHNTTALLDHYLQNNSGDLLQEAHTIPDSWQDPATLLWVPFKGAESRSNEFFNGPFEWDNLNPLSLDPDPDVNTSLEVDTVRLFALSTCNGCHYRETETNNFHILPRGPGVKSGISQFLQSVPTDVGGFVTSALVTGSDLDGDGSPDPVAYNEPRRRVCEFLSVLDNGPKLSDTSGRTH